MNPINDIVLKELQAYFPEDHVECRMGPTGGNDGDGNPEVGKPLFYIPARRVQQRLDNVVGPMGWEISYETPVNREKGGMDAGVEATISICDPFTGEWVSKADVSQNTGTEPMKGGYSKAMVRAGVQWGIGRYLYHLPDTGWEDVEQQYGSTVFADDPSVPPQFTANGGSSGSQFTQEETRQLRRAARGKDREEVKEAFDPEKSFSEVLDAIRGL